MHEGRWYRRDPRNRMIYMYWFVATDEKIGAWLLGLHAEKSATVHYSPDWKAFHVMNMEEDQTAQLKVDIRDNLLSRCNWRWRSRMICYRDVTEGGDQEWFVVKIVLCVAEVSEMGELRGGSFLGEEQLLEWLQSDGGFCLLGHVPWSYKSQILTTTNFPYSSALF